MPDIEITITVKAKDVELIKKHYDLDTDITDRQLKQHTTLFFMLRGLRGLNNLRRGAANEM